LLKRRTRFVKGYLFAAPLLAVLAVAVLIPALYNLGIAFCKFDPMS
jgi:multiple sugar transport system permease protein